MRIVSYFVIVIASGLSCLAAPKLPTVQAVDLPQEIFTGEGLDSGPGIQRVLDSIKIGPKGARFTKEQLGGMADILDSMIKVGESKHVDVIHVSASSDLFASLNATMNGRKGWEAIQKLAEANPTAVPVKDIVVAIRSKK